MFTLKDISENSRKSYVVDLANDVFCNFPPEALVNTFSSYEAAYWLERISYNFLIWILQIYSSAQAFLKTKFNLR